MPLEQARAEQMRVHEPVTRLRDGISITTHTLLETFMDGLPQVPITVLHQRVNNVAQASFVDPTTLKIWVQRFTPISEPPGPGNSSAVLESIKANRQRSAEGQILVYGSDIYSFYEAGEPNRADYEARAEGVTKEWFTEVAEANQRNPGAGNVYYLPIAAGILLDYREQRRRGKEHTLTLLRGIAENPRDLLSTRPEFNGLDFDIQEANINDYTDLPFGHTQTFQDAFASKE